MLLKDVQKTVVVQQIQYIAVCHGKTNSLDLECSETVEDDLQNAVQRWVINVLVEMHWLFPTPQQKKKLDGVNQRAL